MPSLVVLDFIRRRVAKNVEFFDCLFVRHAFERQRLCDRFRHECAGTWSTERILMLMDSGRLVVVHPCSTLLDCCQLATSQNAEV